METHTHTLPIPMTIANLLPQWQQELHQILHYWSTQMVDHQYGGFHGARNAHGEIVPNAPKGVVLQARILWTFSAAYTREKNENWIAIADRAYAYLIHHYWDAASGGLFWSVTHTGEPSNTRKQIYAQAFGIYGLSAYYKATGNEQALSYAILLFQLLQEHAWDKEYGGYWEAFTKQWAPLADWRLSEKDANLPKTMNTHLHILEAFTALYMVWPKPTVKRAIQHILSIYGAHIVHTKRATQQLFFTREWKPVGDAISFGHDVEASWLLEEAAVAIGDDYWISTTKHWAQQMVEAAALGVDKDGALWQEWDVAGNHWNKEKHWWPQAEWMVALVNVWQAGGDEHRLEQVAQVWQFIKQHLQQPALGEWRWGIDENGLPLEKEDIAGFWKCPYHHGRAMIEILNRFGTEIMT